MMKCSDLIRLIKLVRPYEEKSEESVSCSIVVFLAPNMKVDHETMNILAEYDIAIRGSSDAPFIQIGGE